MGFVPGILLVTSSLFAAGEAEPEAAQPAREAAATEVVYDTYHWATPAEFERATGNRIGSYQEAPMLTKMKILDAIIPRPQSLLSLSFLGLQSEMRVPVLLGVFGTA